MGLIAQFMSWMVERQRRTYWETVTAPAVMPSRASVMGTLLAIQVGASGISVLHLWLWARDAGVERFPWSGLIALLGAMFAATLVWSWVLTRPTAKVAAALAAGRAPRELPPELLRATLLRHRPLTVAMGLTWSLGGPAQGLVAALSIDGGWPMWSMILVNTLLCGTITPIIARYELLTRLGFPNANALLPDGLLDPLGEVRLEKVYTHLWIILGLLGLVLPTSVFLLARNPTVSNATLALIALDMVVVGAYGGSRTLRLISLQVGYIADQMDAVRQGRLDASARIFALDTFGLLTSNFNAMVEGLRQRQRLRDLFGRYLTRQVADEILSGHIELGGERRVATVLFADIRGFTHLAEHMAPEDVVALLNQYLGRMVSCVMDEGGVVDKYIGDAIMALFGVPVSAGTPADDAAAAMRAALRMSRALDELNAERVAKGLDAVEIGIGLHTGELIAGNIGVPERMEYTVIGDTVNVSARLESLTRSLGHRVLLSEQTARYLDDRTPLVRVETVTVRGRDAPITVFTLAA